jgi:hypothetical protein
MRLLVSWNFSRMSSYSPQHRISAATALAQLKTLRARIPAEKLFQVQNIAFEGYIPIPEKPGAMNNWPCKDRNEFSGRKRNK